MSKKEEFKTFVSKHSDLVNYVNKEKKTWQDLYEIYDLYGEDDRIWEPYYNHKNNDFTAKTEELKNILRNVNLDALQKHITNAEKALSIIGELIHKEPKNTNESNERKDNYFGEK